LVEESGCIKLLDSNIASPVPASQAGHNQLFLLFNFDLAGDFGKVAFTTNSYILYGCAPTNGGA
jgi:hypothetical protein